MRNLHGRGFRGISIPAHLPCYRTRPARFDALVTATLQHLRAYEPRLDRLEFAIEDVPPTAPAPWEASAPVLSRIFLATRTGARTNRVVFYRFPISAQAAGRAALEELIITITRNHLAQVLRCDLDRVAACACHC